MPAIIQRRQITDYTSVMSTFSDPMHRTDFILQ